MEGSVGQRQQLRQVPRMIPEQIIAGEILQMPFLELEQKLQAEFELNPALVLEEVGLCPMCGVSVGGYPCPSCGHTPDAPDDDEIPVVLTEDWESYRQAAHDEESLEPLGGIASRQTLGDYLRGQWTVVATEEDREVGGYLIDCLDEDGYLLEPLLEIADFFRLSVPQVEAVLRRVQELEPAGVGARDLRECLLIQCSRVEDDAEMSPLAEQIIARCWDDLGAHRWNRIAAALEVEPEDAREAAEWIRRNLAPYPGRASRDAWEHLSPREAPSVTPDVIIRKGPEGFIVEIVESSRFRLGVDAEYLRLSNAPARKDGANSELDPIRRSVSGARFLVDAINQRRRTLYNVMKAVAEAQADFLNHGRFHLKPLMQKTIAAEIGIHESTVCRALADKMVQIPSGETIPTSQFFEDAAPIKETLQELIGREDPAHPLSDSRLAEMLAASGYKIARRTVAKYREALRIPPVETRRGA